MSDFQRSQGKSYYRWGMVFAMAFMVWVLYGAYYSFPVFLKPLSQEFNWTRAATSGAISVYMFMHGFLGIAAGALLDRYGARTVMAVATVIVGLGYLLMSQLSALWQLYLYFGIMVGMGMSAVWIVPGTAVTKYFPGRRGLPLGIVFCAIGAGQLSVPLLASALLIEHGWRSSYAILGVGVVVLALPAAMLLRREAIPERKTTTLSEGKAVADKQAVTAAPSYSLWQAMATLPFWLLFVDWFLVAIPLQTMAVHSVAYATDKQIDPIAAAGIMTLIGVGAVVGRLGLSVISDRIGSKATLLISIALQLVGVLPLVSAATLWVFYLSALVFGLGYGGAAPHYVILGAEYYGLKSVGIIVGVLALGWSLGAAFGAPWAGFIHDMTGSYSFAFLFAAIAAAIALVLLIPLQPPRKLKETPPHKITSV